MILKVIKQNALLFSLSLSIWGVGVCLSEPWAASQETISKTINCEQMILTDVISDFGIIIGKNLLVAFLTISGGLISGGLFTIMILLYNGFLLGIIIREAFNLGIKIHVLILALALHGPIEILAFSLAGSFGLRGFFLFLSVDPYGTD
ncbi:MAG: stage II sporulation protein M [Rhodothermus sp.]|nr:stage II sporulation protein M [Rhodothermus sp.]